MMDAFARRLFLYDVGSFLGDVPEGISLRTYAEGPQVVALPGGQLVRFERVSPGYDWAEEVRPGTHRRIDNYY